MQLRQQQLKLFKDAQESLEEKLADMFEDDLRHKAASDLLIQIKKTIDKNKNLSSDDLSLLTETLNSTNEAIISSNVTNYTKLIDKLEKSTTFKTTQPKPSWKQKVLGAAVIFLGACLIATSIFFAVATFGAGTPISVGGVALSASIMSTGGAILAGTYAATAVAGIALGKIGLGKIKEKPVSISKTHPVTEAATLFKTSIENQGKETKKKNKTLPSLSVPVPFKRKIHR